MGIISRDRFVSPVSLRYSFNGLNKKRLIVALGNIGDEYAGNRHNFGFMVGDALADHFGVGFVAKKDLKCLLAIGQEADTQVIIIKPTTMMNLSGEAVAATANFYKIAPSDILVIHDELDIPFGDIRSKQGGGSAGHNGLKSIIQHIGEDFTRLRLGIGPKTPEQMDTADFVLQDFAKTEKAKLTELIKSATSAARDFIARA